MNPDEQKMILSTLRDILLWCTILSFAILLIWLIIYLALGNWIYLIHGALFNLSRHNIDILMYYGMAFLKINAILFYLFPYIAIEIILKKKQSNR